MTRILAVSAALATLAAGTAEAQVASSPRDASPFGQPRQGFELNLGMGPIIWPAYPGSTSGRVHPFPYVNGGYGNWLDFDVLDGVRVSALRAHGFSAGVIARFREGRDIASSRRHLQGLRGFTDTVEAGGFIAYENGPFSADVSFTQDLAHGHGGAMLDARALLSLPIGRVAISAGPELRVATRTAMQSYYGVSDSEATRSRYPAYRAGGGLERVGALVAAQWRVTDRWGLQGYVAYGRLQNDAASSPLVRGPGGSPDQWQGGAFLSYRLY